MVFPLNPIAHNSDRLTDDEFYAFCQANRHLRTEREADGQIIFEMPTNTKTSVKNADLIADVVVWNRKSKMGPVSDSNGGFTLPDSSVRAPDVSWISNERRNALDAKEQDKFASSMSRLCDRVDPERRPVRSRREIHAAQENG